MHTSYGVEQFEVVFLILRVQHNYHCCKMQFNVKLFSKFIINDKI